MLGVPTYEQSSAYRDRPNDSQSKLSPFSDGYKILKFCISWLINRRSDLILIVLGALSFIIGLVLSIYLISVFLDLGSVPYPSTAIASTLFILTGLQLIFFGISFRFQRHSLERTLKMNFNNIHRSWYDQLDDIPSGD